MSLRNARVYGPGDVFGIWDFEADSWVLELPSDADYGGVAILAFANPLDAEKRAAKHWAAEDYAEAKRAGWCEVRRIADGPPLEDLRAELKAKIDAKNRA